MGKHFISNIRKGSRLVCCVFFISFSVACNDYERSNYDLSTVKRNMPWGINNQTVDSVASLAMSLTLKAKQTYSDTKFLALFVGGNFIGIKTEAWKFIFVNNALTSIEILIKPKTTYDSEWYYVTLMKYFNRVAEYEAGTVNDLWNYFFIDPAGKKCFDSIIILYKNHNSIFIKIQQPDYGNKFFIY